MGGEASRTPAEYRGALRVRRGDHGISVEVGRTETAIDLKMGIEYNKNILQTVEEVRRRITDRVQSMTGLRIKELNATITDITFPEKEVSPHRAAERNDGARHLRGRDRNRPRVAGHAGQRAGCQRARYHAGRDPQPTRERDHPETDAGAEDRPEESAEPRSGDARTEEQSTGETSGEAQTRAENETSEPPETKAEARRRRRAEERARRRTEDS